MQLEPCPACQRHVRTDETVCPFCAAAIASAMARAPRRVLPRARLERAALMSFGLLVGAAAGVTLEACGDDDDDDDEVGESVQPVYGAPPQSERDAAVDAGRDAGMNNTGIPVYGAPAQPSPRDAGARDAGTRDAGDAGDAGRDAGDEHAVAPVYGGPPTGT
jgi:hypothetical protein